MVKSQDDARQPDPQLQNLVVESGLPPFGQLAQFQLAGTGARFVGRRVITQHGDFIDCAHYGQMASSLMTSWKPVRDCT